MNIENYRNAREDFLRARRQAAIEQVLAGLSRRSTELLDYNAVREQLKATGGSSRGLQEIPLSAIIGSVGRPDDYTRSFRPRHTVDIERWAGVKAYVEEVGLQPIDVFQIGQVYFVKDGNHRVSIARQNRMLTVPAYVTEIKTRVELSPGDSLADVLCKSRYAFFLERSNLDKLRPQADLFLTFCDEYDLLLSQIEAQQYLLWQDQADEENWGAAVITWYDQVYFPVIEQVRRQGLQLDFPGRTEADIYVLLVRQRAALEDQLGWRLDTQTTATSLTRKASTNRLRRLVQRSRKIITRLVPGELESGPSAGSWRRDRLAGRMEDSLFKDILIAGRGLEADANLLEHVLVIAQREQSRLLGLRVIKDESQANSPEILRLKEQFAERCRQAGVTAEPAVVQGKVSRAVVERAAWADLLALSLVRRGPAHTALGFGSELYRILLHSPRPILILPQGSQSQFKHGVLAFDGSQKAREALYLSAYMAVKWQIGLSVLTVGVGAQGDQILDEARQYLDDQGVQAEFHRQQGAVVQEILITRETESGDFFILGGFGMQPILVRFKGSTVDQLLHQISHPIFICR